MKSKKKVEVRTESVFPETDIKSGQQVRLAIPHGPLPIGIYPFEGFNSAGDVILKTEKGNIEVPLDKIEIIKGGNEKSEASHSKPAKDKPTAKSAKIDPPKEEAKDQGFDIDGNGQLTIKNIDTPLGRLANDIIKAQLDIRRLQEKLTEDEDVLMKEMKKVKVQKVTCSGHQIVYQPARTTNEKLIIKDLE